MAKNQMAALRLSAGLGKPAIPRQIVWIVIDESGNPIHCAGWPEACHEHINDAINEHGIDEAKQWIVRRAIYDA